MKKREDFDKRMRLAYLDCVDTPTFIGKLEQIKGLVTMFRHIDTDFHQQLEITIIKCIRHTQSIIDRATTQHIMEVCDEEEI